MSCRALTTAVAIVVLSEAKWSGDNADRSGIAADGCSLVG